MIKELRSLTQAGMKDCKDALEESGWDLEKAIDLVKTKGLNIVSGRAGKVAAEGLVGIFSPRGSKANIMAEVNCQTDFVANSLAFKQFVTYTVQEVATAYISSKPFDVATVEPQRQELVATTKENIIVRRWWMEETSEPSGRVFSYLHSNGKIGVLLTLLAPSEETSSSPAFLSLGEDLAMQVAAMNPIAVSPEHLRPEEVERQKAIFEAQLTELKKPQTAWAKILEGKFNKWYTDVCLLNQESVVLPKTTVEQVIKNIGTKLGGEIKVVSFVRCQVGEGIDQNKTELADEVSKMVEQAETQTQTETIKNNPEEIVV